MIKQISSGYSVEDQGMVYMYELPVRFPKHALYLSDSDTSYYSLETDMGEWIEQYLKQHPQTCRYENDNCKRFPDDYYVGSWYVNTTVNTLFWNDVSKVNFALHVSQSMLLASRSPMSESVSQLFEDTVPGQSFDLPDYKYFSDAVSRLDSTQLQVYLQDKLGERMITGDDSREIFEKLDDLGMYVAAYDDLKVAPLVDRSYTIYQDPKEDFSAYLKFQEFISN